MPKPKTVIVPAERRYISCLLDPEFEIRDTEELLYIESFWHRLYAGAATIGYPLFMRTDLVSGKHDWIFSCYVPDQDSLANHLFRVIEKNEEAGFIGVDYAAIVLREYMPLDARFTAFHGMPVAPERRYFVQDGKVVCHHPYWIEAAVHTYKDPLPEDWRSQLSEMNTEEAAEVWLLTGYAEEIAGVLDGAWSLDFARKKDWSWVFIDAATAEDSWHPSCPMQGISGGPEAGGDELGLTEAEAAILLDLKIPEPPRTE